MPKSSSLTWPSALTSTFEGLRSRCTTRLACACATAASTPRNRADARLDAERVLVAVAIDRLAVDVLEDEVGLAARRDAGVDQPRDVRVGQPREQAALALESLLAARRARAHQRQVEQLDRGAALEAPVRALGQPDGPHAALPDRRDQPIGADRCSRRATSPRDGATSRCSRNRSSSTSRGAPRAAARGRPRRPADPGDGDPPATRARSSSSRSSA